jgi:hypothetical protein
MAIPDTLNIFSSSFGVPDDLSLRTTAYNVGHTALKRVTARYFRLSIPGVDAFLLEAHTIRHYIDYSNVLISGDDIPDYMPAFYNVFAQETNKHDNSDHFWPYLQEGKIIWKEDSIPPTIDTYCVYDQDILERPMLGPNEVAVTKDYFDNAQRLVDLERRRELKYYRLRVERRTGLRTPPLTRPRRMSWNASRRSARPSRLLPRRPQPRNRRRTTGRDPARLETPT